MLKSKVSSCTVELLDGRELIVEHTYLQNAEKLLNYVCQQIGTTEKDYFGLRYTDLRDGKISWIDVNKPLQKQLKKAGWKLKVGIQFFPDTIHSLQDEITRYQFVLQTRENLLTGQWSCSIPTQALLASYIIQAEFDDYDVEKHGYDYLEGLQFTHCQDDDFLEKVSLFHRNHKNLSSSDADWLYMKTARKMVLYGMEVYDVMDADGNCMNIGVDVYGIHVLHMNTILHSFLWPYLSKIHCHGKELFINVKLSTKEQSENMTIGFLLSSDLAAKRITKSCNLHKEFSLYGTIRKNVKNTTKNTACSHISTRIMTKDFERVSSIEYCKRFKKELSGKKTVEEEDSKETLSDGHNYSFIEETSKESTSPSVENHPEDVFLINADDSPSTPTTEPNSKPENVDLIGVHEDPIQQVNNDVYYIEDSTVDLGILQTVREEECSETCCNNDDYVNTDDIDNNDDNDNNDNNDNVMTSETNIVPTVDEELEEEPILNDLNGGIDASVNEPNGEVDEPNEIVENGYDGSLHDDPHDIELDLDVLVIEESDIQMLLSTSNVKAISTNSLFDDFEIIENNFDFVTEIPVGDN